MAKKNLPRIKLVKKDKWLLTYADLVTILVIFFIMLYAMIEVDIERFETIIVAVQQEMGGAEGDIFDQAGPAMTPGEIEPTDVAELARQQEAAETAKLLKLKERLEAYLYEQKLQDQVIVNLEERGLIVSFMDAALFPSGSDRMHPASVEIITGIGEMLARENNHIRVEGHTDNIPIRTIRFPSNWELSLARATQVLRKLHEKSKIAPQRLSATGYGEYRPVRPNDTAANRQLNRRVDLIILRQTFEETDPGYYQRVP